MTVREGMRQVRFGWFAPAFTPLTQEPEMMVLKALAPLVEVAWAGPEGR